MLRISYICLLLILGVGCDNSLFLVPSDNLRHTGKLGDVIFTIQSFTYSCDDLIDTCEYYTLVTSDGVTPFNLAGECEAFSSSSSTGIICVALDVEDVVDLGKEYPDEHKVVILEYQKDTPDKGNKTQPCFRLTHTWPLHPTPSDDLIRVEKMDVSGNTIAIHIAHVGPSNTIELYNIQSEQLINTLEIKRQNLMFPLDLKISPDERYVALYSYYAVRQFPESLDFFWPYSQKAEGYLAVWNADSGSLVKEFDKVVFIPKLRHKSSYISWRQNNNRYSVVLPNGSSYDFK